MEKVKNGKPEMKITKKTGEPVNLPPKTDKLFVLSFRDDGKGLMSNIESRGFNNLEQIALIEVFKSNLMVTNFTPQKAKK